MTDQEYRDELRALSAGGEGVITQHDAKQYGYAYVDLARVDLEPAVVALVSGETARKSLVLPVKKDGSNLWVCMEMPPKPNVLERLVLETKCRVIPVSVMPKALQIAVDFHYPVSPEQA